MGNKSVRERPIWEQLRDYNAMLPRMLQTYGQNILPYEQAELNARKVIEPQEMQMVLDNYKKFGGQFNEMGTKQLTDNARALATAESETLAGPGAKLIDQALASQRLADPEYFRQREAVASGYNNLLANLSGTNDSVQEEMARGLARSNPYDRSNTRLLANAMQFGNQGLQQQNVLSQALGQASQALPQLRSGIDAFQVGTGRTAYAMNNPGANLMPTTDRNLGASTQGMGNNLLGMINQRAQFNAGLKQQNSNTLVDNVAKWGSTVGSVAGGLAKAMV